MFGKRIVELRTEKNITQAELAKAIGISRSALALYETEKREPSIDTLNKLASHFNVWVDYLSGHSDQRFSPNDAEWRYQPVSNRLGTILCKYREKHNLSEITFSQKLGISMTNYTKLETGKYIPDLALLQTISKITGYDIDYLTGAIDHIAIPSDEKSNINGKEIPVFYIESNYHFKARFEELCLYKQINSLNAEKVLGLTKQNFNDIRFNRMPTLSELLKISYSLGVSTDYLIGRTDTLLSNLSEDELELVSNYRDCTEENYKKNIINRAKDLSIASLNKLPVAADNLDLEKTGTTGTGK